MKFTFIMIVFSLFINTANAAQQQSIDEKIKALSNLIVALESVFSDCEFIDC